MPLRTLAKPLSPIVTAWHQPCTPTRPVSVVDGVGMTQQALALRKLQTRRRKVRNRT